MSSIAIALPSGSPHGNILARKPYLWDFVKLSPLPFEKNKTLHRNDR
jgi:hypothetical protein